ELAVALFDNCSDLLVTIESQVGIGPVQLDQVRCMSLAVRRWAAMCLPTENMPQNGSQYDRGLNDWMTSASCLAIRCFPPKYLIGRPKKCSSRSERIRQRRTWRPSRLAWPPVAAIESQAARRRLRTS